MVTVNHDPDARFRKDPFHELEGESTQSVLVGNHNRLEFALVRSFQKGEQVRSLPVEARPDVGKNLGIGIGGLEGIDLALEIRSLLSGTDPGVADGPGGQSRGLGFVLFLFPKDPRDVFESVETLPSGTATAFELPILGPPAEGADRHVVLGRNVVWSNESILLSI